MTLPQFAQPNDIEKWADTVQGRYDLAELIRRLILETSNPLFVSFRAQEGAGFPGWDGITDVKAGTPFVPAGITAWELGTTKNAKGKAEDDFAKRTADPSPYKGKDVSFSFVTPRRWSDKAEWEKAKTKLKKWKGIKVYDVDDLATWLGEAPATSVWLALKLGLPMTDVAPLSEWYDAWSKITSPMLTSKIVLSGREKEQVELLEKLTGPPSITAVSSESVDESLAAIAAILSLAHGEKDDPTLVRTLIIESKAAWRYFAVKRNGLVLIPKFGDDALFQQAVENGHHVLIPTAKTKSEPRTISLPRISVSGAMKAFVDQGYPQSTAWHFASSARRNLQAFRRQFHTAYIDAPEWAKCEDASVLWRLALAGTWDEAVEGDRRYIENLVGIPYGSVRSLLLRLAQAEDSPFRVVGTIWSVNVKEDAWRFLVDNVSDSDLRDVLRTFDSVLLEVDPRRGKSLQDQASQSIKGVRREYSKALSNGLSDSIAMLGSFGRVPGGPTTANGTSTSRFADEAVRRIMASARGKPSLLLELSSYLSALAEAAPDEFMSAIEDDIASQNPAISVLREATSFLEPSYSHQLPDALQMLAWSGEYFGRVVNIFAGIVAKAPTEAARKGALEGLNHLFRLWYPQCGASHAERMEALNFMRRDYPEVSWELMLRLMPTGHDSAGVSEGPGYRASFLHGWRTGAEEPTKEEYENAIRQVSEWLLEDVLMEPHRLATLPKLTRVLHPNTSESTFRILEGVDVEQLDQSTRFDVWTEIRELIAHDRRYPQAPMSLPESTLSRLETIASRFAPIDLRHAKRWLFDRSPNLGLPVIPHEEWRELIAEQRKKAIEEILDEGDLESIVSMVPNVESPRDLGWALAKVDSISSFLQAIMQELGKSSAMTSFAQGYLAGVFYSADGPTIQRNFHKTMLANLDKVTQPLALQCYPVTMETFDILDSLDMDVQQEYWSHIGVIPRRDLAVFGRALRRLLDFELPRRAVDEMAMHSYGDDAFFDPRLAEEALRNSLFVPFENDDTRLDIYDVVRLLSKLRNAEEVDRAVLEQLEWEYLPLIYLEDDLGNLRLFDRLVTEPEFFVEIVGLAYKKDDEAEPPGFDREQAIRAHYLLHAWKGFPTTLRDESEVGAIFRNWVNTVLNLLVKEGLVTGGHVALGKMLAQCPPTGEGVWPAPEVCEVIQRVSSDALDRNFEVAIYNSRGVTTRGPLDGGDQERALASKYEESSILMRTKWPRVAKILHRLSETYHDEAKRNDQSAELREDGID